jgi:AAA+ ATPase superfamily predicted ATPase
MSRTNQKTESLLTLRSHFRAIVPQHPWRFGAKVVSFSLAFFAFISSTNHGQIAKEGKEGNRCQLLDSQSSGQEIADFLERFPVRIRFQLFFSTSAIQSHRQRHACLRYRQGRRLCILKGVFPRDPKKKHAGKNKTYYHKKDIMFLQYEPLLQKFRELKTFLKKHKKAMSRQEFSKARAYEKNLKPKLTLDHLVKERYPTFVDALRDIDDPLCMVHLYAMLPTKTVKVCGRFT